METVIIKGRVLPEVRRVSVPKTKPIHHKEPNGFEATFDFDIENGEITVKCDILDKNDNYLQICIVRSFDYASALVDIFAFSKGWSLFVFLDVMKHNDVYRAIALGEQSLLSHCSSFNSPDAFQEISAFVLPSLNLRFAFHDLISSLSTQNYSAIAGARAVEVIRDLISPDTPESRAWEIMRDKLRIERPYLKAITDASRNPRHGKRGATDGTVQMDVTNRAWAIMNRYLEYMKRGGQDALPEDIFDILQ